MKQLIFLLFTHSRCEHRYHFSVMVVGGLFVLLLSSCASKQRLVQQQQRTEKIEMQEQMLLASKKQQVDQQWYSDSTALTEQVLIYPDGAIQFGPEGFVGHAKAVVLLRQQNQKREMTKEVTLDQQSLQQRELHERRELKQAEKVVQSNRWRWASFGSIAVILVLLALAYRYWRKR